MKEYKPQQRIKFRTRQQKKERSLKRFTAVLLAVLVAGGAVSLLAFFKNYNFKVSQAFDARGERESTTEFQTSEKLEKISTDILFFCADTKREHIYFMSLIHLKMPDNKITVYSFSPSETAVYNGVTSTISELYYEKGVTAMADAVEYCTGIKPDKYAYCNETAFRVIVDRYGGVNVDVSNDIEHKGSDFVLILPKGRQLINGDTALKYMRCLPQIDFSKGMFEQSEIIRAIIACALVPENSGNLINRYSYFANLLTTDISIVDFSKVEDEVEAMMNGSIKSEAVANAEDYPKR